MGVGGGRDTRLFCVVLLLGGHMLQILKAHVICASRGIEQMV